MTDCGKISLINGNDFEKIEFQQREFTQGVWLNSLQFLSIGYNGTPSGWDNDCEVNGKTKPEVLHAEANALMKLAQSTESSKNAVLFITHFPCIECAKMIYQAGISKVYYGQFYEASKGAGDSFLKKAGIEKKKKT